MPSPTRSSPSPRNRGKLHDGQVTKQQPEVVTTVLLEKVWWEGKGENEGHKTNHVCLKLNFKALTMWCLACVADINKPHNVASTSCPGYKPIYL